VGVLSGRTVGELYRLLVDPSEEPLDRLQLIGEHGWEWSCGDEILMHPIPAHVSELLACAERAARQMGFGRLLERKRTSIVLHTRSLSPVDSRWIERACAASWKELTCTGEMRLDEIDGGLELRVMGRDKGTTLSELASGAPDGPLMLYVGDDETDEDAFRAIRGRGFGLRVVRGPCLTTADGTLASCQEVVRWLDALCLATRARSAIDAARTLAGIEGTSDTIARLAATNGGVSCDGIRSHRRQR
jgi:trehalose-phosphatase